MQKPKICQFNITKDEENWQLFTQGMLEPDIFWYLLIHRVLNVFKERKKGKKLFFIDLTSFCRHTTGDKGFQVDLGLFYRVDTNSIQNNK